MKNRLFIILLILLALIIFPCQKTRAQEGKKPIMVGFPENHFNDIDMRDAKAAIEVWGNNLALLKPTNYDLQTILFKDMQDLEQLYMQKKIDLLYLPVLDYLNMKDKLGAEPAVCGGWGQEYGDTYMLLVNKESGITTIAGLKNKELLVYPDGSEELIKYWLEVQLRKNNMPAIKNFFSKITPVNKANQALLPVFFNQKTACLIKRHVYTTLNSLNPQIQEKTHVIIESPRYIREVFCVNSKISKENQELIHDIIMSINDDPAGKQILLLFKQQTILPFKQEYLDSIQQLVMEYNQLQTSPK